LVVLLVLPANRAAAPPARTLDSAGDALPPGAVARLGSMRLRHLGFVNSVLFTRDGMTLISAGTYSNWRKG
jgi:hypothetical protein